MRSIAETVEQYLLELPPDRRVAIGTVRQLILEHLPKGYKEVMDWGMISYQVPLELYAETYNGRPLLYAALASQKRHMAVYLTAIYMDEELRQRFEAAYRASGKRYDAGKSCIRFRQLEDLPLALIAEVVGSLTVTDFIERIKATGPKRRSRKNF